MSVKSIYRNTYFFLKTHVCFSAVNKLASFCSVENSEYLSALLKEWGIPHNVLNARPKVDLTLIRLHSKTIIAFKWYKLVLILRVLLHSVCCQGSRFYSPSRKKICHHHFYKYGWQRHWHYSRRKSKGILDSILNVPLFSDVCLIPVDWVSSWWLYLWGHLVLSCFRFYFNSKFHLLCLCECKLADACKRNHRG